MMIRIPYNYGKPGEFAMDVCADVIRITVR